MSETEFTARDLRNLLDLIDSAQMSGNIQQIKQSLATIEPLRQKVVNNLSKLIGEEQGQ